MSIEASDSVQIFTQTAQGFGIDGLLTGQELTMTSVREMSGAEISPTSLINQAATTYLF